MNKPPRTFSAAEGKLVVNARQETESRDEVIARLREIGARRVSGEFPAGESSRPTGPGHEALDRDELGPLAFSPKPRGTLDGVDTRRFQRDSIARQQQLVDGIMALVSLAEADDRENKRRHSETMAVARNGATWGRIAAISGLVGVVLGVVALIFG